MQRQSYYEAKPETSRERATRSCHFAHIIARKEVQEPWFLLALLPTFLVGALRKYAGGIFLASDLGGYAAGASAVFTQRDWEKWAAGGRPRPRRDDPSKNKSQKANAGRQSGVCFTINQKQKSHLFARMDTLLALRHLVARLTTPTTSSTTPRPAKSRFSAIYRRSLLHVFPG